MEQITRSFGILEKFLSNKRVKIVKNIIGKLDITSHNEKILDIGSGYCPNLLLNVNFGAKFGLESSNIDESIYEKYNIKHINVDIEKSGKLPFEDNYFDVVTMCAVIEHISPEHLTELINDIYRILKKNGHYIITTPAKWTHLILIIMSKLKLVSEIEIRDHKKQYNIKDIKNIFRETNFNISNLEYGYFEFFMNIWASIKK